jgi:2-phospho-L-lactate guanylyltransferase (CobY/MobA/RfbA family)
MNVQTSAEVRKGYDRVVVPASGGGTRSLTRKQFENLPLRERVAFLIEGTAQFFLADQPVPAREAMSS